MWYSSEEWGRVSSSDLCWFRRSGEKVFVDLESPAVEADELDDLYPAGIDVVADRFDRDPGGTVGWKRIDAGADGGECDGEDLMLVRESEAAPVTACKEILFVAVASMPDGTDRMEDPLGWQAKAGGGLCVSRGAAVKFAAFREEFRAGGIMYSAVHASATEQRGVRRVHNCIDLQPGDVSLDRNKFRHSNLRFDDTPLRPDGWQRPMTGTFALMLPDDVGRSS